MADLIETYGLALLVLLIALESAGVPLPGETAAIAAAIAASQDRFPHVDLRITSAWLAGVSRMEWRRFLLWNAAGGIVWAVGVTLLALYLGHAAADAVQRFGYVAAGAT
ncbi:MAG: hypothetical protein H0V84_03340 [Actinobacteria bacterium]|nr:hypothetical protein [Actinomycetota bacterium]